MHCKKDFTLLKEDFDLLKRLSAPEPQLCPDCRLFRRLSYYNLNSLYKTQCKICRKDIFSIYSPEEGYRDLCQDCWWSDKWNFSDYAMDYDESRSIFEQIHELSKKVPRPALFIDEPHTQNSKYINNSGPSKDSYMAFNCSDIDSVYFSRSVSFSNNLIDSYSSSHLNNSYEIVNSYAVSNSFFVTDSSHCVNVYYSDNLQNCEECIACSSLRHKKYHIFNKAYDKNTYFKIKEALLSGSYKVHQKLYKEYKDFTRSIPKKFIHERQTENVSGDYIYSSKDVHNSFEIDGAENIRHCQMLELPQVADSMDYSNWGDSATLVYETINSGTNINNIKFSLNSSMSSANVEYSMDIFSSNNVFASVSVQKGDYIILNKSYSPDEYFALRERIIKDMNERPYISKSGLKYKYGEFFPPELSPFYVNDTVLPDYFPNLDLKELSSLGYRIKNKTVKKVKPDLYAHELPDKIEDADESIVAKVIACENAEQDLSYCKKAFKITAYELEFYKKNKIPLPRLCPACREKSRLKRKNIWKLKKSKCACQGRFASEYKNKYEHKHGSAACPNEFLSSYDEKENIIYCKDCYNSEFN